MVTIRVAAMRKKIAKVTATSDRAWIDRGRVIGGYGMPLFLG
jgi:hypothetical protein